MRKAQAKFNSNGSALVYLVGFTLYALGSVLCGALEGDTALFVGYAVPQVAFMITIIAYTLWKGHNLNDLVPVTKVKPNYIALLMCIPITIGVMAQNYFLANGFSWLMQKAGITMSVTTPTFDTVGKIMLGIFILGLLPALGEESMYRGVWISGLQDKAGQRTAIIMSALIFSLSHLNAAQLVHQFILGVVLAYIASETGSVVYGMVIHFLNNTLAIVLPVAFPAIEAVSVYSWQNLLILIGVSVVGAAILYPSLYFTMKQVSLNGNVNIFKFLFKKCDIPEEVDNSVSGKIVWFINSVGYWSLAVVAILTVLLVVTLIIT